MARWITRLCAALLPATWLILLLATPTMASGLRLWVPPGASPNGRDIHWLYMLISPFAALVFVVVEALLLIVIFKWRRSRRPLTTDYRPPQWHGATPSWRSPGQSPPS